MTFLHRFLLIVLFVLSTTSSGIAQFVSSGTGSGVRSGSAGLMGFDAAAQSLGYANAEAMEAAAEQGYGETAEDGAAGRLPAAAHLTWIVRSSSGRIAMRLMRQFLSRFCR